MSFENHSKNLKELKEKFKGEQLQLKIAEYVACKMLDDFNASVIEEAPAILKDYSSKSDLDKVRFDKDYPTWREKLGIDKYLEKKKKVLLHNESNLHWLRIWSQLLKENNDTEGSNKIQVQIAKYDNVPDELKLIVTVIKEKFRGEVQREYKNWQDGEE